MAKLTNILYWDLLKIKRGLGLFFATEKCAGSRKVCAKYISIVSAVMEQAEVIGNRSASKKSK